MVIFPCPFSYVLTGATVALPTSRLSHLGLPRQRISDCASGSIQNIEANQAESYLDSGIVVYLASGKLSATATEQRHSDQNWFKGFYPAYLASLCKNSRGVGHRRISELATDVLITKHREKANSRAS